MGASMEKSVENVRDSSVDSSFSSDARRFSFLCELVSLTFCFERITDEVSSYLCAIYKEENQVFAASGTIDSAQDLKRYN